MSSRLAGLRHLRRALSLFLITAIAASAVVFAAGAPAQAATDDYVRVVVKPSAMRSDTNGDGRFQVGESASLVVEVYAGAYALTDITVIDPTGAWALGTLGSGEATRYFLYEPILAQNTNDAGQGVFIDFLRMRYTADGAVHELELELPPLAATSSPLLATARTVHPTESFSVVDGLVVEGDGVQYSTTITNDTAVTMQVTDPNGAFADSIWPKTLAAGESVQVWGSPQTVTYDDMVAGGVTWPATTLTWQTPDASGTTTVDSTTAATEEVNFAFDASVTTVVHRGNSATEVPFGTAVAGDQIDYRFDATNMGNAWAGWGYVGAGIFPGQRMTYSMSASNLGLQPGASLPLGFFSEERLDSQTSNALDPYVLTEDDVYRGYVDLPFQMKFAPTGSTDATSYDLSQRVYLRDFTRDAAFTVDATLNDSNGDGLGQEGETVTYSWTFENQSDQVMWVMGLADAAGADAAVGATLPARINVDRGESANGQFTYTITAADVARTTIGYSMDADITGNADRVATVATAAAPAVATGEYVAPDVTFTSSYTYMDDNGDGSPSIGETVTFTVELRNIDTYTLAGIGIGNDATADVAGDFTGFPTNLGGGGTATVVFEHVLTAEDFARGTVTYAAELTADGFAAPLVSTLAVVQPISFQAYAADLDAVSQGGVVVCDASGTAVAGLTTGEDYSVKPASCAVSGSGEGYRVVAFSTPMVLAVDSFDVTIPGQLGVGAHRIALYAADGSLVGWQAVSVSDPIALAATGTEVGEIAWTAAALTLAGAGALFAGARRRRTE